MVENGGGAVQVCHVAVADLWAGAEVQLKVLLYEAGVAQNLSLEIVDMCDS